MLSRIFIALAATALICTVPVQPAPPVAQPALYFPLHDDGRAWRVDSQDVHEDGSSVTHFYLVEEDSERWTERLCVYRLPEGGNALELIDTIINKRGVEFPKEPIAYQVKEVTRRAALIEWSAGSTLKGIDRIIAEPGVSMALSYRAKGIPISDRWRAILSETGLAYDSP